jgi:hypothetical protein
VPISNAPGTNLQSTLQVSNLVYTGTLSKRFFMLLLTASVVLSTFN